MSWIEVQLPPDGRRRPTAGPDRLGLRYEQEGAG